MAFSGIHVKQDDVISMTIISSYAAAVREDDFDASGIGAARHLLSKGVLASGEALRLF